MAKIIKLKIKKQSPNEPLTSLQKKLLKGPVMTEGQYKDYLKLNKWMKKWKA